MITIVHCTYFGEDIMLSVPSPEQDASVDKGEGQGWRTKGPLKNYLPTTDLFCFNFRFLGYFKYIAENLSQKAQRSRTLDQNVFDGQCRLSRLSIRVALFQNKFSKMLS